MNIFIIDINLFLCYTNTRKQKARQYKRAATLSYLRRWHRHLHNGKLRTVQATVYPFPAEKARGKGICSHWGGVAFGFPFWNLLRYRVGLCACMVPFCFRDKWGRIVDGHRPQAVKTYRSALRHFISTSEDRRAECEAESGDCIWAFGEGARHLGTVSDRYYSALHLVRGMSWELQMAVIGDMQAPCPLLLAFFR